MGQKHIVSINLFLLQISIITTYISFFHKENWMQIIHKNTHTDGKSIT